MSFNRKSFNPLTSSKDEMELTNLRRVGTGRTRAFLEKRLYTKRYKDYLSGAMNEAKDLFDYKDSVLDIGCGNSPDMLVARNFGWDLKTTSLDLFPPTESDLLLEGFIQADAVNGLPFPDATFDHVICQAMIDLVEPTDRPKLYRDVFRVLKSWGTFTITFQKLKIGWGIDSKWERELLMNVGFGNDFGNMFIKGGFENGVGRYKRGDRVIEVPEEGSVALPRFGIVTSRRSNVDFDFIKVLVDGDKYPIDQSVNSWRIINQNNIPVYALAREELQRQIREQEGANG